MYYDASYTEHFRSVSLFIGGNVRAAVQAGTADCVPIFLHEIPRLFKEGYIKPDIALVHVSPPDEKGFCSFGTSVDCVRSAVSHSKYIVGKFSNFPNSDVAVTSYEVPVVGKSLLRFCSTGEQTHAQDVRRCHHSYESLGLRRRAP